MFVQELSRKAILFPKQPKQEVLSANVCTRKLVSFFCCVR